MKWSELSIHTTQEAVEPISNILHEAGASGVVIEDQMDLLKERESVYGEIYHLNSDDYPDEGVIIKAYLPVNSFLGETVEEIKEAVNNLIIHDIDLGKNDISISEVNDEEWATAWKKYYHPVKISERFTIVPTWETYTPVHSDELIIELDPGMAFGTGTHPTTVLCIQALERSVKEHDLVVDVGTGSGVLSIASAMLGAKQVQALDLDPVAVESARLNTKLNKVHQAVTVSQNNLLNGIQGPVDVVVANILAEVILRFVHDANQLLKQGGLFITSGIILNKKAEVKNGLIEAGFEIEETVVMEDWVAFIARKKQRCSSVQRYFISEKKENLTTGITITGDDVHHISRVMRMKPGSKLICCTSDGQAALCEIEEVNDETAVCMIIEWQTADHELPVSVTIASGLPKGDKLEWILQKGTELGAASFIPFNAARSVVKLDAKKAVKKVERWRKIVKEASEQSYRNRIPEVAEPYSWKELINTSASYDVKIVAYEESAKNGELANLAKALNESHSGQSILVVFGPEGGLTEEEIKQLTSAGFIACGLGPRILRTETAPLYVLSAVSYYFELSR